MYIHTLFLLKRNCFQGHAVLRGVSDGINPNANKSKWHKWPLINKVLVDYCHQQTGSQSFQISAQWTLPGNRREERELLLEYAVVIILLCLYVKLPENTTSETASLQPYDPISPMLKLLIIKLQAQLLNICHLKIGSINPFQAKPCLRTFKFSFFYGELNSVHSSFRKPLSKNLWVKLTFKVS